MKFSLYSILVALLALVIFISLFIGSVNFSIMQVLNALFYPSSSSIISIIVWQLRMPRILLAGIVGAALAVSGVTMQAMFRNSMADPYVIGIASGGALGAAVAIVFNIVLFQYFMLPVFAFAGCMASMAAVYLIARSSGSVRSENLLLSGIGVSIFLSALVSIMMYISGQKLAVIIFWLMGSFSGANWLEIEIALPIVVFGILVIYIFSRDLNPMMLGDENAQYLGLNIKKTRWLFLILTSLITGTAVAFAGIIGFVGLIIPHIFRLIAGPDNKNLVLFSILGGATFMIFADTISRSMIYMEELPVGIITSLIGIPFFLYLLNKEGKYWR
jgi:iron complex transport system permease protein